MPLRSITFTVPDENLLAIDEVAGLQHTDRSAILNEAVSQYLSLHTYHRELIEEGIRQDEAGDVVDHAAVTQTSADWAPNLDSR